MVYHMSLYCKMFGWTSFLVIAMLTCQAQQSFTSYFTGNATDKIVIPGGGICLMGGATENDNAMRWFMKKASGGDVLILRTSGSNGYNTYLYSDLGIPVNSVETIVCHNPTSGIEPYIIKKIQQAEAIWFAGGNQWTYIDFWRNTPVGAALNQAIQQRNAVIGGTSAGMAIQGKYYFTAQNGSVTSMTALTNPFHPAITVDSNSFIKNTLLEHVITDTHFDNPDRRGRLITFLARISRDYAVNAYAIACDEYTTVCIEPDGIARVFGGYPAYDDNAYFVQPNCELFSQEPENCTPGNLLTWDKGGEALKVYQIKGDDSGTNTFDLNNWHTGSGGNWVDWSVSNGKVQEKSGKKVTCLSSLGSEIRDQSEISVFPNPFSDIIYVNIPSDEILKHTIVVRNILGQLQTAETSIEGNTLVVSLNHLKDGIYFIHMSGVENNNYFRMLVKSRK